MASVPQPVPISSTREPAGDAGGVEDRVDLVQLGGLEVGQRRAGSRGESNSAEEYDSDGSRNCWNISFDRS